MAQTASILSALLLLGLTALLHLTGTPPAATNKIPGSFRSIPASFSISTDLVLANATKEHQLKRRDVTITWDEAVAKGQRMVDMIQRGGEESPWTTVDQLRANGWTINVISTDQYTEDYNEPGGPYEQLGIDFDENRKIDCRQDRRFANCYEDENTHQDPTDAQFDQVYNAQDRMIAGVYNFSPLYYAELSHPNSPRSDLARYIPQPHKWSDITWVLWTYECMMQHEDPTRLKYIFKHQIVTENTKYIMEQAVGVGVEEFEDEWPGVRYMRGSTQYEALMGTPHAVSMAYLLINHQNDLGGREIESITMFTSFFSYNLLFTLNG
ncbi:MAG: hypothetical protein Q9191_002666 [Dirinaria sp. TL-2023a]